MSSATEWTLRLCVRASGSTGATARTLTPFSGPTHGSPRSSGVADHAPPRGQDLGDRDRDDDRPDDDRELELAHRARLDPMPTSVSSRKIRKPEAFRPGSGSQNLWMTSPASSEISGVDQSIARPMPDA